jgi:hypothetical protein
MKIVNRAFRDSDAGFNYLYPLPAGAPQVVRNDVA